MQIFFKGECSVVFLKIIMDENNTLTEYNKIPLGHNRTNGTVYSNIYFKVLCSAHYIFDSHPATLHFPR